MKTNTKGNRNKNSGSELKARPETPGNAKQKQTKDRSSLYQTVTDRIIASLKAGKIPWEKPWKTSHFKGGPFPRNFCTGKPYRGINVLLLWETAYASPFWLTYKQAQELGGGVRRGEKGTQIVFYKPLDKEKTDALNGEEENRLPFVLCHYTVFNVEQCDGLKVPDVIDAAPNTVEAIDACEAILKDYKNGPALVLDNEHESRAFYRPKTDSVHMPARLRFVNAPHYYCTLFHELIHSTGHERRLNRTFGERFGDKDYSREELVAEMGAAFLCAIGEVGNERLEQNTTAYLQNWIARLEQDNRLIFHAAGKAQRAVDHVLGETAEVVKAPALANAA